jgi:hypothetical protein
MQIASASDSPDLLGKHGTLLSNKAAIKMIQDKAQRPPPKERSLAISFAND